MASRGTWAEVIRDALLEIGVKAAGEQLEADEKEDSFRRLQGLFDDWAVEGLLVPNRAIIDYQFTSDDLMNLSIGPTPEAGSETPAPDITREKPIETINVIGYRRVGYSQFRPLSHVSDPVLLPYRNAYRTYPTMYAYEQSHPVSRLRFDAKFERGDQIRIFGRGHFADFDIDDEISDTLPVGYREAVLLNLAVKLAPSYGVKDGRGGGLSRETKMGAIMTKRKLQNRNIEILDAPIDPTLRSRGTSHLYPHYGDRWW